MDLGEFIADVICERIFFLLALLGEFTPAFSLLPTTTRSAAGLFFFGLDRSFLIIFERPDDDNNEDEDDDDNDDDECDGDDGDNMLSVS